LLYLELVTANGPEVRPRSDGFYRVETAIQGTADWSRFE